MTPKLVFQLRQLGCSSRLAVARRGRPRATGRRAAPPSARGWAHRSHRVVHRLSCAAGRYWSSAPGGNFGSLEGVARLFSSQGKLLGGWVHFLAFDLFVGRWMVDDTLNAQRSRWALLPCLPAAFMYGPAGLLLYFVIRAAASPLRLPSLRGG